MNRRLFPLALSLALLAGCAPAPEPTPEPTPTPAAAVDFHTFLDAVNEKRRAVIEDGEPLDVSDWTPAFADQNTTFTDGEMELLLTPHGPEENLTMEQAREDVETAFTLLPPPTGHTSTSVATRSLTACGRMPWPGWRRLTPVSRWRTWWRRPCIPCCPRWCGTGTLLLAADT